MELWKVHKFCTSASLEDLRNRRDKLKALIELNKLVDTNALKALELIEEYIELKSLLED